MFLIEKLKSMRRRISECPHPTKIKFRTRKAARERAEPLNMHVYKCVCGKWHMSSCHPDYVAPEDWYDELDFHDFRDW